MNVEFYKFGRGLMPADDEAEHLHRKMSPGEIQLFKVIKVRDPVAHRRYWKLCTLCAENCERIEIAPNRFMPVHSKDDVHVAIKLCTGHYDTIFDAENRPLARIVKSTAFEEMSGADWDQYWPRVLRVVQEKVMPGVDLDEVRLELERCMGLAA
jgi:hypothetical protein